MSFPSVLLCIVLGIVPANASVTHGNVVFDGRDITHLSEA